MKQQSFQFDDGGIAPSSPLQLNVVELNVHDACSYNAEWHSRFPRIAWGNVVRNTHYVCYGFSFENKCYGVAIWSSPVAQNRFKDGKTMLELRRMAISPEAPHNTASRTLSVMVKMIKVKFPEIRRLISYQDTDVHHGTIYKASGWTLTAESKGQKWNGKRKRNKEQSLATKVRWERLIGGQL